METKVFIVLFVLHLCHLSSAAVLKLAGVVPDRGFTLNEAGVQKARNSELKVFVSQVNQTKWRQLAKHETVSRPSVIRVQAP